MRSLGVLRRRRAVWVGVVLLLLAGIVVACGRAGQGSIAIVTPEADFGTIPNDAPVTRVFDIRNDGTGTLKITGVTTSCSCTTAEVADDSLEPGDVTTLIVTFDPTTHNGATGGFMRQVFIRTDNPDMPEAMFTFRVEVVEAQAALLPGE